MKIFVLFLIYFINIIQEPNNSDNYELIDMIKYVESEELFCYNFMSVNDQIVVSTNLGVYKLVDDKLGDKISDAKGALMFNTEKNTFFKNDLGVKIIDSRKLFNETTYKYEIVSGKLLVYKKSIGKLFLEEISVRTFSENYIGTYSGIFEYNQNKIDSFPGYTNSYIREIEDKVFINYDGLFVYDSVSLKDLKSNLIGDLQINDKRIGFALDALKFEENILLFTTKGVWLSDLNKNIIQLDSTYVDNRLDIGSNPKFVRSYLNKQNPDENRILYYNNKRLKLISIKYEVLELDEINEEVLDIKAFGEDFYYLTPNEVKRLHTGISKTLTTNIDFHTILPINENIIVLSSNEGLFKYDVLENKFTRLISKEFNRLALFIKNDKLYAGSIKGYYEIELEDLIAFKLQESRDLSYTQNNYNLLLITFILGGIFSTIIFYFSIYKSKNKKEKPLIEKIENYIDGNLKNVNVDSLKEEFKISYRQLSKIMKEGPGKTIEKRRRLIVANMLNKNESVKSISEKTGYSVEYLYKIKIGKKKN